MILSCALLVSLGLEILQLGVVECPAAGSGTLSERAVQIEPLQVCNHGDSFLGVLFDLPVLLPEAFSLPPSSETLPHLQRADAFVPDGFSPAIDHPPQLSA